MLLPLRPTLLPDVIEEASGEVYHYTSPDGLIGIVTDDALWASEATSLNDLTEVRYGWKLIDEWIRDQTPSGALELIQDAANWYEHGARDVFVLSASLDDDDANQWRLYGADRRGYAIGLDATTPLTVVMREGYKAENKRGIGLSLRHVVRVSPWLRVLYGQDPVFAAMNELLDTTGNALEDLADTDFGLNPEGQSEAFEEIGSNVQSAAATIAALVKPSGFRGENEARVVVTFAFGATHYDYRGSKDGVVPFVKLAACPVDIGYLRVIESTEKDAALPIRSVMLGPRLREENLRATEGLLTRHGHLVSEGVRISRSKVPLR